MKQIEKMLRQQVQDNYLGNEDINNFNSVCKDLINDFYSSVSMWELNRIGIIPSMVKWLQGLPSKLDVLYYNTDIEELFENWGIEDATDAPNRYYSGIAEIIYDNAQ